ncbi:MAG: TerB family tellurite resistance protein, partial [Pseudomonadota bacterium]
DWFSTHPFSPLRVKALKLFERSELYGGQDSKKTLEYGVQSVLSLMEPSYLEARTDTAEAMRRLLFSGLIAVAEASDGISDEEIEVFEKYFGKTAFSDKLNLEKIKETLDRRIKEVMEKASETQQIQIMHDLCVMAKASGHVTKPEREVLHEIAAKMSIPDSVICQILDGFEELD